MPEYFDMRCNSVTLSFGVLLARSLGEKYNTVGLPGEGPG
jgi:hypothetical protein